MSKRTVQIAKEFSRQADAISRSPAFNDAQIVEAIRTAVDASPDSVVLDLACGPGIVLCRLAEDAGRVVGIDATPAMLELARARCKRAGVKNVHFELGEAEALPFPDESFDSVATRLSLHHFVDPATVLHEAARVLKPGARLVIADVVSSDSSEEAALHNALETLRDPTHVRMLAISELRGLVQNAGFTLGSSMQLTRQREFGEWAEVVKDAKRMEPVRVMMHALAQGGHEAGVRLRIVDGHLYFDHTWVVLSAAKALPECL